MKNACLFFLGIVFTVLGCSDMDDIQDNLNNNSTPTLEVNVKELVEFGLSAYPLSTDKNVTCLGIENQHFILKKGSYLSGYIILSGNRYSCYGDIMVNNCSLEDVGNYVMEQISGIITVDGDHIFYYGIININFDTKELEGEMKFANGTGKFISCSGVLKLSGYVDFKSGFEFLEGQGFIIVSS